MAGPDGILNGGLDGGLIVLMPLLVLKAILMAALGLNADLIAILRS